MPFRVFKPTYKEKGKELRQSRTYHVAFRDHRGRRQTVAGSRRESVTQKIGERIEELVECRRKGQAMPESLRVWVDALPAKLLKRLVAMELVDRHSVHAGKPLLAHLEGETDAAGALVAPGFKQSMLARGVTDANTRTRRVRKILEGCGLFFWPDLSAPGAPTRVSVYLGERRTKGEIRGTTLNYYVRDFKGFCRWLAKQLGCPTPMGDLEAVENAQTDSEVRRELSVDEMVMLLRTAVAADSPVVQGLTGEERALLYRFAFETGIRPRQIRALTVADFDLDADPPTVTTHARYVKRRRSHTQVLKPALASVLRERFKTKVPSAAALKLPSRHHMAEMLRRDLARARAAWIGEKGISDEERERRQRSDFLADVNHRGEKAVFYSTRHGHGTALADAGVPEKDIAASMHHASRTTTARYLHSDRRAVARAVAALPDMSYPQPAVATGTNGPEPSGGTGTRPKTLCKPCAGSRRRANLDEQSRAAGPRREEANSPGKAGGSAEIGEESNIGSLAELADAMDSKSITQKV